MIANPLVLAPSALNSSKRDRNPSIAWSMIT
jgi:hypothetical protein